MEPGSPRVGVSATNVSGAFRTNPDVSYNANPADGVATYDAQVFGDVNANNTEDSGWLPGGAGGTSVAAAQWAGLVASPISTRHHRARIDWQRA